jgi:hypothetical protein
MLRLIAVVLVAIATLTAWCTRSVWRAEDAAPQEVARIPPSETLTAVFGDTLCRRPVDAETVEWDSRPFTTSELHAALALGPEGKRVGAVRQVYLKVLLRDPFPGDCEGLRQWVDRDLPVDEIERRLAMSPEAQRVGQVRQAFTQTLGRDPAGWDTASLRYWVESGLPPADIGARLSAQRPLVGVYYFTWYKSIQGQWGNGATFVGSNAPKPSLGWYESEDPKVMDAHIRQMVDAGVDFVVVNLGPETPWNWANAHAFFGRLKGHPLKAVIMLDDLYKEMPSVKAGWVDRVKAEFLGYPNYLSYHDRPLLLLFASRLDFPVSGVLLRNVYWTPRYGPGANTFNLDNVLYPQDWPFWADTPPPLVNGLVPVMPGYIDTHLGRDDPMVYPRNDGRLYHEQWQSALAQKPELIMIYSWNEYFEQSAIEPTEQWGDSYVRWTKCYIAHAHAGTSGTC